MVSLHQSERRCALHEWFRLVSVLPHAVQCSARHTEWRHIDESRGPHWRHNVNSDWLIMPAPRPTTIYSRLSSDRRLQQLTHDVFTFSFFLFGKFQLRFLRGMVDKMASGQLFRVCDAFSFHTYHPSFRLLLRHYIVHSKIYRSGSTLVSNITHY